MGVSVIRRFVLVVWGVLWGVLLSGCAGQSASDELLEEAAANIATHPDLSAGFVTAGNFQLHYRSIGTAKAAVVIWIHGTPGGWSDIRRLMVDPKFTDQVRLISVDRLGWGSSATTDSSFRWGDFNTLSNSFTPLLQRLSAEYPNVPIVVAGHSWGGSFVPTLVANHPDLISGALIFASGLNPSLSAPRWYNRLANTWAVQQLLGDDLLQANLEIYALQDELTKQVPRLAEISMPILVVQGKNDKLVSPQHLDFAEQRFNPKTTRIVRLPNQGHLLQVQRPKLIGRCILAVATKQLDACKESPYDTELR